jgi:hypothetical protein
MKQDNLRLYLLYHLFMYKIQLRKLCQNPLKSSIYRKIALEFQQGVGLVLTLSWFHKTTNNVEGWHSKFQKAIVTHHAIIWKSIEYLQIDQHVNNLIINQLLGGHAGIRHPTKNHKS